MSEIKFRFIPENMYTRLFTDYGSSMQLIEALKSKEKDLGKFSYLSGKIYFKPGFYSTYKDGTEAKIYNNPRWWKTGAKSCVAGCCTHVPYGLSEEDALIEATEPAQIIPKKYNKNWQEFKRIGNLGGLEEQLNLITDKSQIDKIVINDRGYFQVI